jgi:WD40 repeat protein
VLSWMNEETLVAGCEDHAIKLVDVEKSQHVTQSILTDSKVPTCIDTDFNNLVLSGCEDGVIRLWDVRASEKKQKLLQNSFKGHRGWISAVKFNPISQNVFVSASIDGTVKLWDMRNDEGPVAQLKHKSGNDENLKMYAVEWNGAS